MRLFTCLLDPTTRGLGTHLQRAYEALPRAAGLAFEWRVFNQAAVLTASDNEFEEPLIAVAGDYVAVGLLRLDRPRSRTLLPAMNPVALTDIEFVLRAVAQHGAPCIQHLLGDFAFAVWNASTWELVAATDPFAVKKLYYAQREGLVALSSRAEALALTDTYEAQHLSELVAGGVLSRGLTPYHGVRQVPAGTLGRLEGTNLTTHAYWETSRFEPDPDLGADPQGAAETCRDLLHESIRVRLDKAGRTWAQLSGGLDSSSVVSLCQHAAERGTVPSGLAGTITYVDLPGTESDEREFSRLVVERWRVPNHTIVNPPLWLDEVGPPPRTDQPRSALAMHPRERRLATIVRSAHGSVLLSGFGGDELFTGTMLFFADWIARGYLVPAVREMARRSVLGHISFWELSYRNAVLPLLPPWAQRWLLSDVRAGTPWLSLSAVRRYDLRDRLAATTAYRGPAGGKYRYAQQLCIAEIGSQFDPGFLGDLLDVRYPFLHRPLVEFALRLPSGLCAAPQARKWVLREAMRGILPEPVRTRIGKGDPRPVFAQSLASYRQLLEPLTRDPVLAQLGVVDAARLRAALAQAPERAHRRDQLHNQLHSTLSLEAWLQMRAGRWPPTSHTIRKETRPQVQEALT